MRLLFLFLVPDGLGYPVSFFFGTVRANHDLPFVGFRTFVFAIGDQNRPSFGFGSRSAFFCLCWRQGREQWNGRKGEESAGRKMGDSNDPCSGCGKRPSFPIAPNISIV